MSNFAYIGKATPRSDGLDKAAGKAVYISDLQRPGMLHGKIKFSEHPHALIKEIDTSAAERLPGVKAVLTGANTPMVRFGFLRDNVALKRDKVRAYRDEVAAVAAIDPDIAAEAVELIRVEYEPLPAVFSPEEAMAEGAPRVHETDGLGKPVKDNILPVTVRHSSGSLEEGRAAAKHIVEVAMFTSCRCATVSALSPRVSGSVRRAQ